MSASAASRAVFRQPSRFQTATRSSRRWASTTEKATEAASQTTSKAKETVANIQSKASEGLSKVSSSAGPAISGAASRVSNVLGRIGGRTGRLISAIESSIPQVMYYSRVGVELGRLVFNGQRMSIPSLQTFQSYFSPLLQGIRHPSSLLSRAPSASNMTPESMLSRVRNVDRAQLAAGGVILAEVLGFFTVGEMVGRRKVVGYRGEVHHEH